MCTNIVWEHVSKRLVTYVHTFHSRLTRINVTINSLTTVFELIGRSLKLRSNKLKLLLTQSVQVTQEKRQSDTLIVIGSGRTRGETAKSPRRVARRSGRLLAARAARRTWRQLPNCQVAQHVYGFLPATPKNIPSDKWKTNFEIDGKLLEEKSTHKIERT